MGGRRLDHRHVQSSGRWQSEGPRAARVLSRRIPRRDRGLVSICRPPLSAVRTMRTLRSMVLRVIKRLPVYLTGVGFAIALAAVANARHWSDLRVAVVGLGIAAFYVVLIFVPMLIREERARARGRASGTSHIAVPVAATAIANLIVMTHKEHGAVAPARRETARTYGPAALRPSRPHASVR